MRYSSVLPLRSRLRLISGGVFQSLIAPNMERVCIDNRLACLLQFTTIAHQIYFIYAIDSLVDGPLSVGHPSLVYHHHGPTQS